MKPYGRNKKIQGAGSWKKDYHIHLKNRKVGNWWEDWCTTICRSTMKSQLKKEVITELDY